MGIQDAHRALHDQPVQIRWTQIVRESLAEPVQKIEDPDFLHLEFFACAFKVFNGATLAPENPDKCGDCCRQQS